MMNLFHKRILLGITGSIAAYKSADLTRKLREAGAEVRVAMTDNAKQFITPLTMQAVSGNPVHDNLFDSNAEAAMGHIELARWADVILIAPASADFMSRLATGRSDDLLCAICLASKAKIAIAPAMNQGMWQDALTQENLRLLKIKNVQILGPAAGNQACGDIGPGRMLEPLEIIEKLTMLFATGALANQKILVTAGPTHEYLDPIRYISNASSGKMGYALAEAAREAGAAVTLVSGPTHLAKPNGVEFIPVISAEEMHQAVMSKINEYDIFLSVAAVGDYRSKKIAAEKIAKYSETLELALERNQDIVTNVAQLAQRPFIVGFAAETENVTAKAKQKRERKKMDVIIANQVGNHKGMGMDENAVTFISVHTETELPLMPKRKLARELIEMIAKELKNHDRKKSI